MICYVYYVDVLKFKSLLEGIIVTATDVVVENFGRIFLTTAATTAKDLHVKKTKVYFLLLTYQIAGIILASPH